MFKAICGGSQLRTEANNQADLFLWNQANARLAPCKKQCGGLGSGFEPGPKFQGDLQTLQIQISSFGVTIHTCQCFYLIFSWILLGGGSLSPCINSIRKLIRLYDGK